MPDARSTSTRVTVIRAPQGRMRSLLAGSVALSEIVLRPGARPDPHEHGGTHACVVLSGRFDERVGSSAATCAAGDSRVSPAGDRHELAAGDGGLRCLLVQAHPDAGVERPRRRTYLNDGSLRDIAGEIARALDDPRSCPLELETLGLELLAAGLRREDVRAPGVAPRWLREARDRLRCPPAEPLRIGALAAALGVHRVHLVQSFRRHFGLSPGEYLRRRRCLLALRLLLDTRKPLSEIALDAGFSDQSHLTRALRRYLGATPAELRRTGDA